MADRFVREGTEKADRIYGIVLEAVKG